MSKLTFCFKSEAESFHLSIHLCYAACIQLAPVPCWTRQCSEHWFVSPKQWSAEQQPGSTPSTYQELQPHCLSTWDIPKAARNKAGSTISPHSSSGCHPGISCVAIKAVLTPTMLLIARIYSRHQLVLDSLLFSGCSTVLNYRIRCGSTAPKNTYKD